MLKTLAELLPAARFPYRLIPRGVRAGVSEEPIVREWFRPARDEFATLDQTLRSVMSMTAAYAPPRPLNEIERPVLVVAGSSDRMLPLERVTASLKRMSLRCAALEVIDGSHMLLHERPEQVIQVVARWMGGLERRALLR